MKPSFGASSTTRLLLGVVIAISAISCASELSGPAKPSLVGGPRAPMRDVFAELTPGSTPAAACPATAEACARASIFSTPTQINSSANTWLQAAGGLADAIFTTGRSEMWDYSGTIIGLIPDAKVLTCFDVFARSCPAETFHDNADCTQQILYVELNTQHTVAYDLNDVLKKRLSAHASCAPNANGGSDMCENTPPPANDAVPALLGASAPRQTAARTAKPTTVPGKKASFDCGATPPGGQGLTCIDSYIYLDISYDGGQTWTEVWEGWAPVCDV